MVKKEKLFHYKGYSIPVDLVMLTGGGTDDWELIAKLHMDMYRRYTPISAADVILEIGCGVGRDAIELAEVLSEKGQYTGTDIIKPSIDWCKKNISSRHKNFKFVYHNIESQIHNSGGVLQTTDIRLPLKDNSVDRIFLHSVFTHMFEKDIVHYLKEFHRVLKSDGLILASFFVVDDLALEALEKQQKKVGRHPLSFEYTYGKGCYINDPEFPEGAVGYTPQRIRTMLRQASLGLHGQHVHRGVWSGMSGLNGQDVLIMEKVSPAQALIQSRQPLKFTGR